MSKTDLHSRAYQFLFGGRDEEDAWALAEEFEAVHREARKEALKEAEQACLGSAQAWLEMEEQHGTTYSGQWFASKGCASRIRELRSGRNKRPNLEQRRSTKKSQEKEARK